jgi:isocitrate dehydrogenase
MKELFEMFVKEYGYDVPLNKNKNGDYTDKLTSMLCHAYGVGLLVGVKIEESKHE